MTAPAPGLLALHDQRDDAIDHRYSIFLDGEVLFLFDPHPPFTAQDVLRLCQQGSRPTLPADVADIRARCEAVAGDGAWEAVASEDRHHMSWVREDSPLGGTICLVGASEVDTEAARCEFIAGAYTDIPYLLTTIATLTAECERLRAALEAADKALDVTARDIQEWCDAVDRNSSWDGWDHWFKHFKWGRRDKPSGLSVIRDALAIIRALQPAAATGGEGT